MNLHYSSHIDTTHLRKNSLNLDIALVRKCILFVIFLKFDIVNFLEPQIYILVQDIEALEALDFTGNGEILLTKFLPKGIP